MSYKTYRARVERMRTTLQAELSQANHLRFASHLPLWDIEGELDARHPLLPEEAWTAQQQERKAFARFRQQHLAGMVMPTPPAGADWERIRATSISRAFLEHKIRQAWFRLSMKEAGF